MLFLLVLVGVAAWIYWYLSNRLTYFAAKGIAGPRPHWLKGSLDSVFCRPNALVLHEWTQQYGKTYGYYEGARPVIVTSDIAVLHDLFVKKFHCFHGRKFSITTGAPEKADLPNLFFARGLQWKRYRAIANPTFAVTKLMAIVPTFDDSGIALAKQFEKLVGKGPIDVIPLNQSYTLDVICRVAMGQQGGSKLGTDEQKPMLTSMQAIFDPDNMIVDSSICYYARSTPAARACAQQTTLEVILPELLPFWQFLEKTVRRIVSGGDSFADSYLLREVERRRKIKDGYDGPPDFIQLFLDAEADEGWQKEVGVQSGQMHMQSLKVQKRLTTKETVAMCNLFVIAGFDTTSVTMSLVTHLLAVHPDVQQRIHEEILHNTDADEVLSLEALQKLKYLDATIRETLRLYPIGSIASVRECQSPCSLGGLDIPTGMLVQADVMAVHRDLQLWGDDADHFRPERFLEPAARHQLAWLGFGAGPRMCIAMRFAMLEVKAAFCHVLRRVRFVATDRTRESLTLRGTTLTVLAPKNVFVEIESRQ